MATIMPRSSSRFAIPRGWSTLAILVGFLAMFAPMLLGGATAWAQSSVRPPEASGGAVPGGALGTTNDSELWRQIRRGAQGTVSIPDKKAGILVQPSGEKVLAFRRGPITEYVAWALLGVVAILALFFLLRGRIKIESGFSGHTVLRFNTLERVAHWMTAGSFIVLGLTGLNLL